MNEIDFDRTARLWLDDGPSEMPDRGLDAALAKVHRTRQRRAFWPAWMDARMPTLIRVSAVVAAVLIALVGIALLAGGAGAPPPTPSPSPRVLTADQTQLEAGTYVAGSTFRLPVTTTVPAGWSGFVSGPYAVFFSPESNDGELSITTISTVFADPCHSDQGTISPEPGPTVDDLVAALRGIPSLTVSPATDITMNGHLGKELTITAPASLSGCSIDPGTYRVWQLLLGDTNDMTAGERQKLRIVDIGGTRYVIDASEPASMSPVQVTELEGVMDSIQFPP
jgi:hypothetical protein